MNNLTKLKYYLDRAFAGGKPAQSKFRITDRSYNDKQNQHEVTILFSYRNSDDLPVSPTTNTARKQKRRLFDEIVTAKKLRVPNQKDNK